MEDIEFIEGYGPHYGNRRGARQRMHARPEGWGRLHTRRNQAAITRAKRAARRCRRPSTMATEAGTARADAYLRACHLGQGFRAVKEGA